MRDLGRKGTRCKKNEESYYKGKYHIAFYQDTEDGPAEKYYKGFNNVFEICEYKGWPITKENINRIHQALYKATNNDKAHYTSLIDDIRLSVELIDMTPEIKREERKRNYMKQFVKINSSITFEVYPDLNAKDTTNPTAPMADRLQAKPDWVYPVLIQAGIHFYPSEIKTWAAIKAANKRRLLSISEEVDENEIPEEEKQKCIELKRICKKIAARITINEKSTTSTK